MRKPSCIDIMCIVNNNTGNVVPVRVVVKEYGKTRQVSFTRLEELFHSYNQNPCGPQRWLLIVPDILLERDIKLSQ
jgi:hypothetical protein